MKKFHDLYIKALLAHSSPKPCPQAKAVMKRMCPAFAEVKVPKNPPVRTPKDAE
jgi:hypothetical protein